MNMRADTIFIAIAFWLFSGCVPDGATGNSQLVEGKDLYLKYCSLCHATNGEGYAADAANALANDDFLAIASDEFLFSSIEKGRPGTPMSAWGRSRNGPLEPGEIDAIVAWIRNWQNGNTIDLSNESLSDKATRGEPLYDVHCSTCHGEEGKSGEYMSVSNPEFLAAVPDAYLRHSIAEGRSGTPMTSYGTSIPPQGIDDLVALIRSWQTEVGEPQQVEPTTVLVDVVLNPDGPDPEFTMDERFVGVDEVFAELNRNAKLTLADARPTSDFLLEHITGAVNVPFYDAELFVDQLPKESWIVVYCACPHAESGQVADLLESKGFTKVKVLDEGFFEWKDRGYPVTEQGDE